MSKVKLVLEVKEKNAKNIYDAIIQDVFDGGRSTLKIKLEKDILKFVIEAEDYTAIRAVINAVLLKLRMINDIEAKIIQK